LAVADGWVALDRPESLALEHSEALIDRLRPFGHARAHELSEMLTLMRHTTVFGVRFALSSHCDRLIPAAVGNDPSIIKGMLAALPPPCSRTSTRLQSFARRVIHLGTRQRGGQETWSQHAAFRNSPNRKHPAEPKRHAVQLALPENPQTFSGLSTALQPRLVGRWG